MGLLPPDFESGAYTNFATSARIKNDKTILLTRQPPRLIKRAFREKIIAKLGFYVIN
jgi:hypothetical protein